MTGLLSKLHLPLGLRRRRLRTLAGRRRFRPPSRLPPGTAEQYLSLPGSGARNGSDLRTYEKNGGGVPGYGELSVYGGLLRAGSVGRPRSLHHHSGRRLRPLVPGRRSGGGSVKKNCGSLRGPQFLTFR